MSKKCLKIFEYDTKSINCDAHDFCISDKEAEQLIKLNNKLKKEQLTKSDVLKFNYRYNKICSVSTSSYVGAIKVGNKTIQIMPKIARDLSDNEAEHSDLPIKNLLYLLSYTKRLKVKETDISSLRTAKDDFYEVLINLFAKNLLDLTRRKINREYIQQEENLCYIRGKIQINNHTKLNSVSRHKFYVEYDDFSEDNLINQIFKYTIILLSRSSRNLNNLKLLQELNFIFSDIPFNSIKSIDFSNIKLNRLNQDFDPLLNLCKLFIGQSSLELSSGGLSTYSFVVDMNVLFEEFIGEFIKRNFRDRYNRICLQQPCRWLVNDKLVNNTSRGPAFQLRPDIQLFDFSGQSNPNIIIDTKYKILENNDSKKEGVSQSDIYQMNAYSKKYNCSNIILLYPLIIGHENRNVKMIIDDSTNIYIRTVNLCRDIKRNLNELKIELGEALNLVSH
ncbi:MAG: McrC family protein [Candidatus Cloacimonetes bacterium]|nr:McrC family protein [Candidatus Cloacimonadota bacterium]